MESKHNCDPDAKKHSAAELNFLGLRGPLVLPLVDPYGAIKIWSPIYRHICLMNHQETPQTNPMAQ